MLDNTWHHVCFTWEKSVGNLSLYIDGLLIGQKQSVLLGDSIKSSGTFVLGQLQEIISGNFVLKESYLGDITDVNMWTSVLTWSVISEQSRSCYRDSGDLLSWSSFSSGLLQVQKIEDSVPAECRGFGRCISIQNGAS